MKVLIEIERKDGVKSAVYFEDEKHAERVSRLTRGDSKIKKASIRKLNNVQGAVSAYEAVELLIGLRIPDGLLEEA